MGDGEDGAGARSGRSTAHGLTFEWRDGDRQVVSATGDESVLAAAEAAGVSLPFGCRTGACTPCAGRVRAGTVAHGRPPLGLKPRHLVDGYALLCVAEPRSDCRIEVGADVQSDLVSNPWG